MAHSKLKFQLLANYRSSIHPKRPACINAGQESSLILPPICFLLVFLAYFTLQFVSPSVAALVSHLPYSAHGARDDDTSEFSNATASFVRRAGVDSSLLKYALLVLSQEPKTDTVYNVTLSAALRGIKAQAIQLRSGRLTREGLSFNEFSIPKGAALNFNESLLMIYRSTFNFTVYTLPSQYQFAGPVVGIITYSFSNLTAHDSTSILEVPLTFDPNRSISIHVPLSDSLQGDTVPLCAFFSVNGTVTLRNVSSLPNVCTTATLGDVAMVLPSSTLSSSGQSSTIKAAPAVTLSPRKAATRMSWEITVGMTCSILGGLAFCIAAGLVMVEKLRWAIEADAYGKDNEEEALETTLVGDSRAPTAAGVRTKPILEMDMARFTD